MSPARPAALALAITTLAATGCGSSGPPALTHAQLVAKAEPICARANAKFDSTNVSTPQAIAHSASQLSSYLSAAAAELDGLVPPSSMGDDWKTIVGDYQTLAKSIKELGQRAKASGEHASHNNLKANLPVMAALTNAQHNRSVTASRDGFVVCAKF